MDIAQNPGWLLVAIILDLRGKNQEKSLKNQRKCKGERTESRFSGIGIPLRAGEKAFVQGSVGKHHDLPGVALLLAQSHHPLGTAHQILLASGVLGIPQDPQPEPLGLVLVVLLH